MSVQVIHHFGTGAARGTFFGTLGNAPTVVTSPLRTDAVIGWVGQAINANTTSSAWHAVKRRNAADFAAICRSTRFYFRMDSLPSANNCFCATTDSAGSNTFDRLLVDSSGHLIVQDATGANGVTSTLTLSADVWYRIEFDGGWSAGSGRRVYVDGVEFASSSTTTFTTRTGFKFGNNITGVAQSNFNFYFCDFLIDSDTFANGFPGAGMCACLLPTADSNRGTWTGGAGGTSNLFEALNNTPPIGNATPTDAAQISNPTNSANQDGVFTMQSYSVAGVPAGATVNSVGAFCIHGEQVSTATKEGGVWIASNVAQSATTNFDYGDDSGAESTYIGNWRCSHGAVSTGAGITLGTAPTVTVRKTTATTRVVDVCFLGISVDFTPAPAALVSRQLVISQAVKRASLY